jgi:hypothetical protein
MPVIGQFDRPDGHWYVDPLDQDLVYRSVTNVLGATTSKPWMEQWAAKLAAQFCVRNLDLIQLARASEAGDQGAVDLIKGAARRARELKADVGRYVHDVQEALIIDGSIPLIPPLLEGQVVEYDDELIVIDQGWLDSICEGFMNFVVDFDVDFEMAEATVVNPDDKVAGTLDWIAVLKTLRFATRVMGDTKTGAKLDRNANEQMAAYRQCKIVWLDNLGNRARMPRVDRAAILHLRTGYERGYKLLEQPAGEAAYERFRHRLALVNGEADLPKMTGRPLYPAKPDGSQPPPLIEDVDVEGFNGYRKPLLRAGIRDLGQLAAMNRPDVLKIKGLGGKAPAACDRALARYGLHFHDSDPNLAGVA